MQQWKVDLIQTLDKRVQRVARRLIMRQPFPFLRRQKTIAIFQRANAIVQSPWVTQRAVVFSRLIIRNKLSIVSPGSLWVRSFEADEKKVIRVGHHTLTSGSAAFFALREMLPVLPSQERKLFFFAITAQIAGIIGIVFISKLVEHKTVDWILAVQSLALIISTLLVGECSRVNGKTWNRILCLFALAGFVEAVALIHFG